MLDRSSRLPQPTGAPLANNAGVETDPMFTCGAPIPTADHALLSDPAGRAALADHLRRILDRAPETGSGVILDAPTWKAHPCWSAELGEDAQALRRANHEAVAFVAALRDEFAGRSTTPILLNAPVGPRRDAARAGRVMTVAEARDYHAVQLEWLSETEVDMVTATTHVSSAEATGFSRAASDAWLRHAVGFAVEADGRLPSGETLAEAIRRVDLATNKAPAWFMAVCASPEPVCDPLEDADWARRLRGVRCTAANPSDARGPVDRDRLATALTARVPWIAASGGGFGSDLRRVG